MPRYAAFLRAVNLGSKRKASSADLCVAFEEMGFEGVATFRTSGNVVFEGPKESAAALTTQVEKGLKKALGFEIPVFLRTTAQIRAIAAHEPFPPKVVKASEGKLQVALVSKRLAVKAAADLLALATDEDRLAIRGTELYWLPSGGIRDSKLNMKAIDRAVGAATMRTKGTIDLIAEKFFTA